MVGPKIHTPGAFLMAKRAGPAFAKATVGKKKYIFYFLAVEKAKMYE